MSTTGTDPTPLLSPAPSTGDRSFRPLSRQFSRRASLHGAARLLRRTNSRGMLTEQSVRVRENAAQQIEDRQSGWAYSTPIVVLDLLWNLIFVTVAIVTMLLSTGEKSSVPLRLWLCVYGVQCVLHIVCVCFEYRRKRRWSGAGFVLNRSNYSNSSSISSSSNGIGRDYVDFSSERRVDDEDVRIAKHLESANIIFSYIWWIIGFHWISSGGESLAEGAPKLFWLTVTYLAFDAFFVLICVVVTVTISIAVCCCFPYIIAILYAIADEEAAIKEDIDQLPRYKFRRIGDVDGETQESLGGIMTECDTDTPIEHVLSLDDAECCICLSSYHDGVELRELPCCHHFHSPCIDKWLHINATCPLCKYNILNNGNQSGDEV